MGKLRKINMWFLDVGMKLRQSDIYYKDVDMNTKRMLNDLGKILQELARFISIYRHSDETKKLKIRRKIANIVEQINIVEQMEAKHEKYN